MAKRPCRGLVLLAWCAALGANAGSPPRARAGGPVALDALDSAVLEELQSTDTPGAAVVVVDGEHVVYARGFGVANVETGSPVTPDTVFQIGSMTKSFTAAAVVALAEEGKLDLQAPVGTYVPGLSPRLARVTTHQLLTHTAGILDEPDEYGLHDESALGAYVRSWGDAYCLFAPGEVFSYSNSGMALAGLVLEEAGVEPYATQVAKRLFAPLGMAHTTFQPLVAMTYTLAVGHRSRGAEKPEVIRPLGEDWRLVPAGGIWSTANDLARFAIALLHEGRLEGKQVLPAAVVAKVLEPRVAVPVVPGDFRYGYGVIFETHDGVRTAGHEGTMPGYLAMLRMSLEHRVAIIVLANREGPPLDRTVARAFELALGDRLGAGSRPVEPAPAPLPMIVEEMSRYVGSYAQPHRWTIELDARDGALVLRQFGTESKVTKVGDGRFSFTDPRGERQLFELGGRDAAGRPEYLRMFLWAFARVRPASHS